MCWRNKAKAAESRDQIEGRPPIGQQAAKFAVEVGIAHRERSNGFRDGRVFLCPVVAAASQDLHSAAVEPGVHPISVEL
jgi:hypothetical protein